MTNYKKKIRISCWNDGFEDGKTDRPFNKDRDKGCDEYGNPDYEQGYNSGCITDNTDNACQLLIKGEEGYCPCIQILRDVWISYIMLPTKDQNQKPEHVREWEILVKISSAPKKVIPRDIVL